MLMNLEQMTGEQLLLVSVLGEWKIQDAIDQELDRRAVLSQDPRLRRSERWSISHPRHVA